MEERGRITRIDRGRALVRQGDELHSVVDKGDPPLTVGDDVVFEGERLVELLPRTSLLTRLGGDGQPQLVAANVDLVLVACGLDRPAKPGRILRAITQTRDAGATPLVVLTKADLADADAALADLAQELAAVDIVTVSTVTGEGIDDLRNRLAGKTAVLIGESGAGKSSLINLLTEGDERVGEVRAGDAKGRHTTSWRQLVDLPGGGALIDTPGVRSLGLWTDAEAVEVTFDDIAELAAGCRFRDCAHDREPGCAVQAAVERGELAQARFNQYLALRSEADASEQRRQDERG